MKVKDPNLLLSYTVFKSTDEDTVEMSVETTAAFWEKEIFFPLRAIAKSLGPSKLAVIKTMNSGGIATVSATYSTMDILKSKGFSYFANPIPRKL